MRNVGWPDELLRARERQLQQRCEVTSPEYPSSSAFGYPCSRQPQRLPPPLFATPRDAPSPMDAPLPRAKVARRAIALAAEEVAEQADEALRLEGVDADAAQRKKKRARATEPSPMAVYALLLLLFA